MDISKRQPSYLRDKTPFQQVLFRYWHALNQLRDKGFEIQETDWSLRILKDGEFIFGCGLGADNADELEKRDFTEREYAKISRDIHMTIEVARKYAA